MRRAGGWTRPGHRQWPYRPHLVTIQVCPDRHALPTGIPFDTVRRATRKPINQNGRSRAAGSRWTSRVRTHGPRHAHGWRHPRTRPGRPDVTLPGTGPTLCAAHRLRECRARFDGVPGTATRARLLRRAIHTVNQTVGAPLPARLVERALRPSRCGRGSPVVSGAPEALMDRIAEMESAPAH